MSFRSPSRHCFCWMVCLHLDFFPADCCSGHRDPEPLYKHNFSFHGVAPIPDSSGPSPHLVNSQALDDSTFWQPGWWTHQSWYQVRRPNASTIIKRQTSPRRLSSFILIFSLILIGNFDINYICFIFFFANKLSYISWSVSIYLHVGTRTLA